MGVPPARRTALLPATGTGPRSPRPRSRRARTVGTALLCAVLTGLGLVAGAPGSAAAAADQLPIGAAAPFIQGAGGIWTRGWAIDPNTVRAPVTITAVLDGRRVGRFPAGLARADVARAHPKSGANHGFSQVIKVPAGRHSFCVRAWDTTRNIPVTLRCQTFTVNYGPRALLDPVRTTPGKLTASGWAADPDIWRHSSSVVVTIDGKARTLVASQLRPELPSKLGPYPGRNHGFTVTVPAAQGTHTVCLTAKNVGFGADLRLPCRSVTLDDSPFGAFDTVTQRGSGVVLRGWAIDRDAATSPVQIRMRVDGGTLQRFPANVSRPDIAGHYPGTGSAHGFVRSVKTGEGLHEFCVSTENVGFGAGRALGCRKLTIRFTPTAALTTVRATATGIAFGGWASDPDTAQATPVRVYLDGKQVATVSATGAGGSHSGHNFTGSLNTRSGRHTVCAVAVNRGAGTKDSPSSCRVIATALAPLGHFDSLARVGNNVRVVGWAFDPDGAAKIAVTVDGKPAGTFATSVARAEVVRLYPSAAPRSGFAPVVRTSDWKHTVCVTAKNVGAGKDVSLGCKLIIAVHPVVPSGPRRVTATSDYGASRVSWLPPVSDGGAPPSKYVVIASSGKRVNVPGTTTSVMVTGLKSNTRYRFTVTAVNVAGGSVATASPIVRTQNGPPPQTSPAPISTSRYVRNIRTCTSSESTQMYRFGQADARHNPSGHRYLMLLDIGGQNGRYGGVVLSATTRFVTYADLLRCSQSYVSGYASQRRAGAPATIAIGVNNDMDVNAQTGRDWATRIVNPLVAFARRYPGLGIAGANDIEPGFRGSYAATRSWVLGYLGATKAAFIFNGSADGCAWTVTNRSCNNGWTMGGLYHLAAGASPTRIVNLPQIYNYTMADQWKYISLTGIGAGKPRINFGGPLTEVTACAQAGSCGSIGGASAWRRMWSNLQSHPMLRVRSLPYSTDLRIDS